MKAHIGVDAEAASYTRRSEWPQTWRTSRKPGKLLHGEEKIVFLNAGDTGVEKHKELKNRDIKWVVANKPSKIKQLSEERPLGRWLRQHETLKARIRARVEHHAMKNLSPFTKDRYKELAKNTVQPHSFYKDRVLMTEPFAKSLHEQRRRTAIAALVAHWLRIGTACACAVTVSPSFASSVDISTSVNLWLGATSSDWFDSSNWKDGVLFGLPRESLAETYIGPSALRVEGILVGFLLPNSEAVLGARFSTPRFQMGAWDGLSQIRLLHGGILNATSATIGHINELYRPSGARQAATVVLDGGEIAGNWNFLPDS